MWSFEFQFKWSYLVYNTLPIELDLHDIDNDIDFYFFSFSIISSIVLITNFTTFNKLRKKLYSKKNKWKQHAYGLMHPYKHGRAYSAKIYSSHLALLILQYQKLYCNCILQLLSFVMNFFITCHNLQRRSQEFKGRGTKYKEHNSIKRIII